jgi:uncharacterized protein (DUF427 family)
VTTSLPTNPLVIPAGTLTRGQRRVRPYVQGHLVADAGEPLLAWEHGYFPVHLFAPEEVEVELVPAGPGPRSKVFGPSQVLDVVIGDLVVAGAAVQYPQAPDPVMREHTLFRWDAMTTWLEEDEVVHSHARSPYVRVDALPSSRHVEVRFNGVLVADSRRPVVLFETGLPARYYLPRVDVRMDLLTATATTSHCPYKGAASYWTLAVGDRELRDVAWGYDTPLDEARRLAGLVVFWPEKDAALEMTVDGVRVGQGQP